MFYITDSVINENEIRINQDPKAGELGKYLLRKWHGIALEKGWGICQAKSPPVKGSGVRKAGKYERAWHVKGDESSVVRLESRVGEQLGIQEAKWLNEGQVMQFLIGWCTGMLKHWNFQFTSVYIIKSYVLYWYIIYMFIIKDFKNKLKLDVFSLYWFLYNII